jgi:hypothetical protein
MAAKNNVVAIVAKPSIKAIANMTKAEREAYIASRTGAQPEDVELDLSKLAKNTADALLAGLGRAVGTAKEIGCGAKSSFMAGYLSALDD